MHIVTTSEELKKIYDTDYHLWVEKNINLLRERLYEFADWENLIVELEDMGRKHLDEAIHRIVIILLHLYKLDNLRQFTRGGLEKGGQGWKKTILNQRRHLNALIKAYPSIKAKLPQEIDRAWILAIPYIIEEAENLGIDLKEDIFPEKCPYSYQDIMEKEILL